MRMCLIILSKFSLNVFLPFSSARFLKASILDVVEPNVILLSEEVAKKVNNCFFL